MLMTYELYYRKFGAYKLQHLFAPRIFDLSTIVFPRSSLVHYLTDDIDEIGPAMDHILFLNTKKKIYLQHQDSYGPRASGMFKRLAGTMFQTTTEYRTLTKTRYYPAVDVCNENKDETMLNIINYNAMRGLYRYVENKLTALSEDTNMIFTMFDNVKTVYEKRPDLNQFIIVNIPTQLKSLPTERVLYRASEVMRAKVLDNFDTLMYHYLLSSIDKRNDSGISAFNTLDEHTYLNQLNFIFIYRGKYTVLNAGNLIGWDSENKESHGSKVDNNTLSKVFIQFGMSVHTAAFAPTEEVLDENLSNVDDSTVKQNDQTKTSDSVGQANLVDDKAMDEYVGKDTNDLDTYLKNLDDSLAILETTDKNVLKQKGIKDVSEIEKPAGDESITNPIVLEDDVEGVIKTEKTKEVMEDKIFRNRSAEEALLEKLDSEVALGVLTNTEYKAKLKRIEKVKTLGNPFRGIEGGDDTTLHEYVTRSIDTSILDEENKIPDMLEVVDKTMLESRLRTFDKKYVRELLNRDLAAGIYNIQKAGFMIEDYKVGEKEDLMGLTRIHSVKMAAIDGTSATLKMELPVVDDNGEYMLSGNKYRTKKVRQQIPIRKLSKDEVSLTSYYGKTFVERSKLKANSFENWISELIINDAFTNPDTKIKDLVPGNVFDRLTKSPAPYSAISANIVSFNIEGFSLNFDRARVTEMTGVTEAELQKIETDGHRVCGTYKNTPVLINENGDLITVTAGKYNTVANLYSLLGTTSSSTPIPFSVAKVFSKSVPVAVILGYYIGLDGLIQLLDSKHRTVPRRKQYTLGPSEWEIVFKDKVLILDKNDKTSTMVLAGLRNYKNLIKRYPMDSFFEKDIYLLLLEDDGLGSRYIKEIEIAKDLFVDPITEKILIKMKEPTTYAGLLIRSSEMLTDDTHPEEFDPELTRIAGYERFAGLAYREWIMSVREYKSRRIRNRSAIEMSPFAVKGAIAKDTAKMMVQDINPIENLKQQEAVTLGGEGGLSKQAMSKLAREYHLKDTGLMSESTSDSADVGYNTYLSSNPLLTDTYGLREKFDFKKHGATSMLSTASNAAVGSHRDDPKRISFISIQHSHTVATQGYEQPYVRTGMESVIAQRTTDLFAYAAVKNGKVLSINENGIIVEYEDGERKGVELGRRYGMSEGSVYPHDVISNLKVGEKFEKGTIIAYNSSFFEVDFLNRKNVVWKTAKYVKTILTETNQVIEDSSAISKDAGQFLKMTSIKMRNVVVDFDKGIRHIVKVGDTVEPGTPLYIIEDNVTNVGNLFDEETLGTLKRLSDKVPKAKYTGKIDRIEVVYNGDPMNMSESLREITKKSDATLKAKLTAIGKRPYSGSVNSDYRVDGSPLITNQAEIRIYIAVEIPAGVGDKGVFANQMKSTFGQVMEYELTTKDGEKVDAIFGRRSIAKRIVNSADLVGTTTSLLKVIAKRAVSLYKGAK